MILYRVYMIREFDSTLSKGIGPVYMILTKTVHSLESIITILKQWIGHDFTYISYTVKGRGLISIRKYPHLKLLNVFTEPAPGWTNHSIYVINIRRDHNATLVKETPEYLLYEVVPGSY